MSLLPVRWLTRLLFPAAVLLLIAMWYYTDQLNQGAFYAFPNISRSGLDDEQFAERLLLEEKVAVVPGSAFGEMGRGHIRICYAQNYDLLEEALQRMSRFIERHASGNGHVIK